MKNVYLIACTKSKQNYRCTAEEMYKKSALYRLSYEYCLNFVHDKYSQIYILSAKHHLLSLTKVIEPYNETLTNMKAKQRKEWGQNVYKKMQETFDMDNTHFIFLTGKEYMKPIIPYLESSQYSSPIPSGYGIGKRMRWLKNNAPKKLVKAKELRNIECLRNIPNDMPGWYKWWAPKQSLELLLNSPYISKNFFSELLPHLTVKNINGIDYYYIYVGVAIKESIKERLNWHVNQHHLKSSVESGFLSTLRQTIASLISGNQYDEEATNKFIDTLIIEYYPVNMAIKSLKAKDRIEKIEQEELSTNNLPLNLKDNKKSIMKSFLKELKNARRQSK